MAPSPRQYGIYLRHAEPIVRSSKFFPPVRERAAIKLPIEQYTRRQLPVPDACEGQALGQAGQQEGAARVGPHAQQPGGVHMGYGSL